MQGLVIDPFHGAAGDMILGAFLDLGVPEERIRLAMASVVAAPSFHYVDRQGIRALAVQTHAGPSHRSLSEVLAIIRQADTDRIAIEMAERIFTRIAKAEEEIHGQCSHFHEVGADDAIADIIGSCTAVTLLAPDFVTILPVAVGGGEIEMAHGHYPVPAPATLSILRHSSLSVQTGTIEDGELCTPTGAAILAEVASIYPSVTGPRGRVVATGYGAGNRNPPGHPNVLRMMIIRSDPINDSDHACAPAGTEPGTFSDKESIIDILETNVDDISGEIISYTISRLMEEGARDACAIPCTMKKGRPGNLIRVISLPDDSERLAIIMASELGTLGVRCIPSVHRFIAERDYENISIIDTDTGYTSRFPVKIGFIGERQYLCKAEYEDAQEYAKKNNIPLRIVMRMIEEKTSFGYNERKEPKS